MCRCDGREVGHRFTVGNNNRVYKPKEIIGIRKGNNKIRNE